MIEIFDDNGDVKSYMSAAERLPAFLEAYGPQMRYHIETRVLDYLGLHPHYADLHRAALAAGTDSKLPPIDTTLFCFQALLTDSNQNVVAKASALRRINTDLDVPIQERMWEAGETAALQRLMARLGFGSDTLLADEQGDMTHRGLVYNQTGGVTSARHEAPEPPPEAEPEADSDELAPPADPEPVTPVSDTDAGPVEPAQPEQPAPASPAANGEGSPSEVSEAVLRQINHLATVRGVEPPEVTTKAQAKQAIKELQATPAAS